MYIQNVDLTLAMLPFGLVPLIGGILLFWRELEPSEWLRVRGTIVSSEVETRRTSRGREVHIPLVEYEYAYLDRRYSSTQRRKRSYVSAADFDIADMLGRYPVGKEVTVWLHPHRPEDAVLEHGPTPLSRASMLIGLLFTGMALLPLFI